MKSGNVLLKQGDGAFAGMVLTQRGGETIVREHVKRNASATPSQVATRALTKEVGRLWRTCSEQQMSNWGRLAARYSAETGRAKTMSAYQMFGMLNKVLMGTVGRDVLLDAPASIETLPMLGTLDMAATLSVGGVFTLRIVSGVAYPHIVSVSAAQSASAGVNYWAASSFTNLTALDSLSGGAVGTSIGPDYAARYGVPAVGQKICIKVQPVSPSGFRGLKYTVTGIVTPPAAAVPETDDEGESAPLKVG